MPSARRHSGESAPRKKVDMEIVCIFSSDDESEIEWMKNQLEERGVPTLIKNLYTQNLFSGIKLFSGHDAIAGSIQLYVREDEVQKSLEILRESGFDMADETAGSQSNTEEMEEGREGKVEAAAVDERDDPRKAVFAAYLLTCLSIFVIPFLINVPILFGLGKTRRTASIMLGLLGGVLAITGGYFMTRYFVLGRL
jgi:hypothetical protein